MEEREGKRGADGMRSARGMYGGMYGGSYRGNVFPPY